MAELAGVMVGNYFLLECLGREGMVETYRARPTTRGGFDVVLRLFRPAFPDPTAFQEHFASEVEKVWRCHHEYIQPLLEFGAGDGLLYSVTEFAESGTLEQVLQEAESQEHFVQLPLVVRYITQICAALQYAHEQHIVHGNVQPSSILVRSDQHILLTNFSMKHNYQEGEPLVAQIEEGNPAYTAPEQVVGMLSPASDIYAVGVLLYRLLTGHLPYDGESPGEIALKHTNEAIPSLHTLRPDLAESVELVVRVALAKSPEARFPSMNALAEALLAAVAFDSPPVVSVKPQRRIEVRSRRRTPVTWSRALSLLAISLVLFGLVGTLFFFSSLPLHLQDIPGFPFHTDGLGGVMGMRSGTPTPTTASGGVTPSTPSTTGNSTPQIHITPTAGLSQTPGVNGTVIPTATPPVVCATGTLAMDGSLDLQPLLEQIDTDYGTYCPGLAISLRGDGSRASLNKVQHSRIDVAGSDLTASPVRNLTDHPVGALLYALIVSPDVQVSGLSSVEIKEIYQGQITNWAQVGGSDEAITVVLPPTAASISAIFQTFVLNGITEHIAGIRIKKDSPAMVAQAVSQAQGAISFVPLAMAHETGVKILAIDGVSPSTQTLLQGTYAFWSNEHFYTQGDGSAAFLAYLQFFSSDQEANMMSEFGFVPVSMLNQSILSSHLPGPEL
jgi:serine/threonine protein kinase